jgi:protein-S-isoprenylcysteine O-methyltransferase Ste14
MLPKLWVTLAAEAMVFAGFLFGAAGTLSWPPAWAFLGVVSVAGVVIARLVLREDPALLHERRRWPVRRTSLPWDRILIVIFTVLFPGWLALMALDAVRFDWTSMPDWLQIVGGIGVAIALSFVYRVFEENAFLARIVRVRTDLNQKLISTGPYAVIRHPFYAAVLFFCASTSLMLGSWVGLGGVLLLAACLAVRAAEEDRQLRAKIEGYADYARRVRYRLLPGVW